MEKWITPVNFCLVFLIITVMAMISSTLISHRIAKTFPVSSSPAQRSASAPPAQSQNEDIAYFSAILEKGLFGPASRGRLTAIAVAQQQSSAGANVGEMVLLGSVIGSFRETFALIQKPGSKEERVFRLGDTVFDAGQLVSVRKEFAEILSGGQRVKILSPNYPAAAASPASTQPAPSGGLATQVSAGSYIIDQRALNASLDNIGQAMTDARLLPSMKEGKVEGFRASEVKPNGIFGMLGIKNGDVLLRINDFPIDSPEKAIQSLGSLKGQSRIKLDMVRDGQPSTFSYDIR